MNGLRIVAGAAAVAISAAALAAAGCGPGNNSAAAPVTSSTSNTTSTTFATIAGPPTTLSTATQNVTVPTVSGVSAVGGTVTVSTTSGSTNAIVTVASATTAGTSGGPPVLLQSNGRRGAKDFSGVTTTAQYYVGVTNTGTTPTTINIPNLNLGVNVPPGQSAGLAHYDPSQPQNGWNQHCAFGAGQVNTAGNTTTFVPGGGGGGSFTIFPGATLWFAPYTYTSNSASPSPAPQGTGIVPTPAPAPASLTGTYVGSAQQTSPSSQGSQYLEFSLTQSGTSLSGTYAVLPSGANDQGSFGSLSGTVSGGAVTLNATAQFGGSCTTTLSGTASGMLVTGTFSNPTNTQNCNGAGNFSAVLQTASLPSISGNYSGTINDGASGSGTLTFSISTPGTVFSGTGTVAFPSNPNAGGTSAIVGFVTNPTTAQFAVIGGGNSGGNNGGGNGSGNGNNGGGCQPFGTLTLGNNGATLTATYSGGGSGSSGCTGTGTFTISH